MEERKEAAQGSETGGSAPTPPKGDKLVPESQLLAVKGTLERKLEKASQQEAALRKQVADLSAKVSINELEAGLHQETGDETLAAHRRDIVEGRKALIRQQAELTQQQTALAQERAELSRTKIAAEMGIDVQELVNLDDAKDMRLRAYELKATAQAAAPTTPAPPAKQPPQAGATETGAGAGGGEGAALSPIEQAKRELAFARKQRARDEG